MLLSGSTFGDSPLEDNLYQGVVSGWNDKRNASSQTLSNLTPFVELYCVFGNNDIIYNNNEPSRFTSIAERLCDVKLKNAVGKPFEDPSGNGITTDCKIARVGSTEFPIGQLGIESAAKERRWTGGAGISDLTVARGSSGSFNVKYDINITLPDPELLNENYEYSKLMLLNSPFIIMYGWNIDPSQLSGGTGLGSQVGMEFPPKINPSLINENAPTIRLNNSNGGFWYASLVVLYKYEFSFDNVGHLGGKVSFVTSSGNFLATIQTGALASSVLSRLTDYSEPETQGDRRRELEGEMDEINRILGGWIRDPVTNNLIMVDRWWVGSGTDEEQRPDTIYGSAAGYGTVSERLLPRHDIIADIQLPFPKLVISGHNSLIMPVQGGLGDLKEALKIHIESIKLHLEFGLSQSEFIQLEALERWVDTHLTLVIDEKQARFNTIITLLRQAYDATASGILFKEGIPFAPEKEDIYKIAIKVIRDLALIINNGGKFPKAYDNFDEAIAAGKIVGDAHPDAGKVIDKFAPPYFTSTGNPPVEANAAAFRFMGVYVPASKRPFTLAESRGVFFDVSTRIGQNSADDVVDLASAEMAAVKTFVSVNILKPALPQFGGAFLGEVFNATKGSFFNPENQNYSNFTGISDAEDNDPEIPVGPYWSNGNPIRTYETIKTTSVLSVPLQKYAAEGELPIARPSEDENTGGDQGPGDSVDAPSAPRFIPPAQFRFQPIYYFLGSVLEAIRLSTKSNKARDPAKPDEITASNDPGKIRFFYAPVPESIAGRSIPFPIPVPSEARQQDKKEAEEIKKLEDQILELAKVQEKTPEGEDQLRQLLLQREVFQQDLELVETFFDTLDIRTIYDIPVNLKSVNRILTQNPNAPAHNLINQLIGLVSETIPAIRLATRPHSGDDSIIEIFIASIRKDNVITEVFTELDVTQQASLSKEIGSGNPRIMVAQFGHVDSLVENFNLSSKMDPNAFTSFRLPAVIGGAEVNIAELVASNVADPNSPMLGDIRNILEEGLIAPKKALSNLNILELKQDGSVAGVKLQNLKSLLMSENPALRKINATLVENLMAQNANFYNTIIALQAEVIQNPGGNEKGVKAFFGTVLSSFLRTATLTVHGTVGLNCFNYVYLKGLLSGIEGLYLISSVNESLTPGNFTTTLECKLMQYKNNSAKTNPFAYSGAVTLSELSKTAEEAGGFEGGGFDNYEQLVERTNAAL